MTPTIRRWRAFKQAIAEVDAVSNDSAAEFLSNYMKELLLFVERVLTVHPYEG